MKESLYLQTKRKVRSIVGKCFILKAEDAVIAIKDMDVVSFDIFDTLVKRDIPSPEDIHFLVGKKFIELSGKEINDYFQKRVRAEREAREFACGGEITLQQIFEHLKDFSQKDRKLLMALEQEMEYEVCCQNHEMKRVYDKALEQRKHVVITSDMYLSEELILKILKKCGYIGYEKLYLSSCYGVTKSSGKLYGYLKKDYVEISDRIIHIGDDVKSDFYRAKQSGFAAVLIDGAWKKVTFYKKCNMRTWEEKCFYAFINNHKPTGDDSFAKTVGYEILGPMLWGYSQWLQEQIKADGIEKIFFLSRDGALLQKAYQILYPDSRIRQVYLYASRQALQVPMLAECRNYYEMIQLMKPMMHSHTLENIGKECQFDNHYEEGCRQLGLEMNLNVFHIPAEKQQSYYELVYRLGEQRFREQIKLIQAYLKEVEFRAKVAVVDIGWQGTMQKALLEYCGNKISVIGYYLGVRNVYAKNYYEGLVRKGYLFDPEKHEDRSLKLRFTTEVIETMFSNSDGSVAGYRKESDGVVPCLGENEYSGNADVFVEQVQTAALQFLTDRKQCSVYAEQPITDTLIMKGYSRFAVKPTLKTVNYFKNFYFFDGGVKKMVPGYSLFYYLCHPQILKMDINASVCKIFVLKHLFKLPLPYYSLLKFFLYRLKIKTPFVKHMEQ